VCARERDRATPSDFVSALKHSLYIPLKHTLYTLKTCFIERERATPSDFSECILPPSSVSPPSPFPSASLSHFPSHSLFVAPSPSPSASPSPYPSPSPSPSPLSPLPSPLSPLPLPSVCNRVSTVCVEASAGLYALGFSLRFRVCLVLSGCSV
jgi:hypothetical protein